MSMVQLIKAVENAVESPVAELDFDRFRWTAHVRLMIAAALAEAEKVDNDLDERIRVAVAWSQKAAMADAKWKRAREAWKIGRSHLSAGPRSPLWEASEVLDQFFGGGEGEG